MSEMQNIVKIPSLIEFDGSYTIKAYVLKFSEEIYTQFLNKYKDEKNKERNMKIAELNSGLMSYLTDIYYANFIKKDTIDKGWIVSSNPDILDEIKMQLNLWLKKLGLTNCKEYVETLEFEKQIFTITNKDIEYGNMNCKLLLSYLSKILADKLNFSVRVNKKKELDLEFIYVNNDNNFRVLALFPERKVNVANKDYYYNYYFELYPVKLDNKEKPYVGINIGQLLLASENAKTIGSNIYPYIIIGNNKSEGDYKITAFKGLINNYKENYKWNPFVEYTVKNTIQEPLVNADTLINNPLEYINPNLNISILIPHGTHMKESTHNVGSGVDLQKRKTMLKMIENELRQYDMFGEPLHLVMDTTRNSLKKNVSVANDKKELVIDLFYINNETKEILERYINIFNDKEKVLKFLTDINIKHKEIKKLQSINKKKIKDIDDKECKDDYDIIELESLHKEKEWLKNESTKLKNEIIQQEVEEFQGVSSSSIEKLYNTLTGEKINNIDKCPVLKLNLTDFSQTNPCHIPRSNSQKRLFEKKFNSLNCNKNIGVSIVELEGKEYFSQSRTFDPKTTIRKLIAKNYNKSSQFMKPMKETDKSKYDKLNKIILECFRQLGYVHVREKIDSNRTYVGICRVDSQIVMTCVIGKNTYGKFQDSQWMPYNELLIYIASKSNSEYTYNSTYIEDSIDELFNHYNIVDAVVCILSRQLKSIIPYLTNQEYDFNLKIGDKKQISQFTPYDKESKKNIAVVVIDDTINAEWFKLDKNGEIDETKFSMILSQINENLFVSICSGRQGVLQNYMSSNSKIYREDSEDTISAKVNKSEPIFMNFIKNSTNSDNLSIARELHFSKSDTSIQHCGAGKSTEETKLPLCLNISILASEFITSESTNNE